VVEGSGLENRQGRKSFVSSNLTHAVPLVRLGRGDPLMRIVLGCLSLGLLAAVLSCGSGSNSEEPNPTPTGCVGQSGGDAGEVTVGNDFFRSDHNGTCNPAVDTISVGGTATWTWVNTGAEAHSVRFMANPQLSSGILTGPGSTYTATFTAAGTYQYDCAVHEGLMTGRVVVQ
jgi:plastocyanin